MTLAETQRRMAAAVMLPLKPGNRLPERTPAGVAMAEEAAAYIKPNSGLSSLERLAIYSRSYWFRLLDSLREDFPGLAAVLGARRCERLARAYLADCPSRSFTLRNLGSQLEGWLARHPEYADGDPALARDMVRLEWAHIEAFDGPAEEMLGPQDLVELKPGLRAGLQPYIRLLELNYAVDEFRVKATGGRRRGARPRREHVFVAVHRLDLDVYYRRLGREEFRLLSAVRAGRPIAAAIATAFTGSPVAGEDLPELLRLWFSAWAEFGWLTRRRKRNGGSNR
jgi:hypothetical protein